MSGRNSERLLPPGPHSAATCTESADLDEQKQKNNFSFLHIVQFKHYTCTLLRGQRHDLTSKYQRELLNIAGVKHHGAPAVFLLFEDYPHL